MTKIDLLFATSNKNKVLEIKKVLPKEFNIKSLDDIGFCEEIPENEIRLREMLFLKQITCIKNII